MRMKILVLLETKRKSGKTSIVETSIAVVTAAVANFTTAVTVATAAIVATVAEVATVATVVSVTVVAVVKMIYKEKIFSRIFFASLTTMKVPLRAVHGVLDRDEKSQDGFTIRRIQIRACWPKTFCIKILVVLEQKNI